MYVKELVEKFRITPIERKIEWKTNRILKRNFGLIEPYMITRFFYPVEFLLPLVNLIN